MPASKTEHPARVASAETFAYIFNETNGPLVEMQALMFDHMVDIAATHRRRIEHNVEALIAAAYAERDRRVVEALRAGECALWLLAAQGSKDAAEKHALVRAALAEMEAAPDSERSPKG